MSTALHDEIVAFLPRLRRFSRALTGSADSGDDLVQSTCEKALARLSQFKEGTRLDSWLFQIARNHWIDQLRSKANQTNVVDIEQWGDSEQAATSGGQETHMALHKVDNILANFPEEQRILLVLVCVEGFAYKEVSDMLDIPVGTVMSRLARARLKLAQQLNDGNSIDIRREK